MSASVRVSRIPLYTRWRTSQRRLGQHRSNLAGAGLEFTQLKEYQEGDAARTINWAATARRGGTPLLVNTYTEDKGLTVILLADLSGSMDFGSVRLTKKTLAADISASLVYSALVARDRVGLIGFTSELDLYFPPRQSQAYLHAIPEAIRHTTGTRAADFTVAATALEARCRRPALVFLLSDFLTDDPQQLVEPLARLRCQHDLIALVVADPRESTLPPKNARMACRDLETGTITVYHFSDHNCSTMAATAQARRDQLQRVFETLDIAQVTVTPYSDYHHDLVQLFRRRQRGKGSRAALRRHSRGGKGGRAALCPRSGRSMA
jgi:uncharacterized protein (DUF58 family)